MELTHPSGTRATVHLHGAHVTSFVDATGAERLFVSEKSEYRAGAAIRGGVPVIFPQFGPGPIVKHGFARTSEWSVEYEHDAEGEEPAIVRLALRDSATTRAIWPHRFRLELRVALAEVLTLGFTVTNTDDAPWSFTGALHTYLAVSDIAGATLSGLEDTGYVDQLAGGARRPPSHEALGISGPVDRVYVGAPVSLRLDDDAGGRALAVHKVGFEDTVVWNPWVEGARALADMTAEGYRRMLCVEAAQVERAITLAPGASWSGSQTLEP